MKTDALIKGVVSLSATAIVVLSGFIYTQGSEFAALKKDVAINSKNNDIQYRKIEKNNDEINNNKGISNKNSLNFTHIKEDLTDIKEDIKELLKEMRSNSR